MFYEGDTLINTLIDTPRFLRGYVLEQIIIALPNFTPNVQLWLKLPSL